MMCYHNTTMIGKARKGKVSSSGIRGSSAICSFAIINLCICFCYGILYYFQAFFSFDEDIG